MVNTEIFLALLSFFLGGLASAALGAWWLAQTLAKHERHMISELGNIRQDFQKSISQTGEHLRGRLEQLIDAQSSKDTQQDRAIHQLELKLARKGIDGGD